MIEGRLEQDLKAALLARDKTRVTILRGLKSVLLDAKVAHGTRGVTMPDEQVIALFAKEAKNRQESADLYKQGGSQARADAELFEKTVIEEYLPRQLSDEEIGVIVDRIIAASDSVSKPAMGTVIGAVKRETKGAADGATIARIVKDRLGK